MDDSDFVPFEIRNHADGTGIEPIRLNGLDVPWLRSHAPTGNNEFVQYPLVRLHNESKKVIIAYANVEE